MDDFKKVIRFGTVPTYPGSGRRVSVFCKIEWKAGKLSISGVEGPYPSGNCAGSCGQIDMHMDAAYLASVNYAPDWCRGKLVRFLQVWRGHHLNDMRAGSPRQMEWLRVNPGNDNYTKALEALTEAGLNPDAEYLHNGKPYVYGTAWLRSDVPEGALEFLRDLPDTDKQPAWV